jgi:hypothetical protein
MAGRDRTPSAWCRLDHFRCRSAAFRYRSDARPNHNFYRAYIGHITTAKPRLTAGPFSDLRLVRLGLKGPVPGYGYWLAGPFPNAVVPFEFGGWSLLF